MKWNSYSKKSKRQRSRDRRPFVNADHIEVWHYERVSFFLNSPPLRVGVALLKGASR